MKGQKNSQELLEYYFGVYQQKLKDLLGRIVLSKVISQNAGKLEGKTVSQLLAPARSDLAAHVANTGNAHQETLDSLGTSSRETVIAQVETRIPTGVLPLSTYGVSDGLTDAQVLAAWTGSSWTLTCNRSMQVILSGEPVLVSSYSIDLRTVSNPAANRTFYVYLVNRYGTIQYRVSPDPLPESNTVMYLGSVSTGSAGITGRSFNVINRIDIFRPSTQPLGSVIPSTGGTIDAIVRLPTTWNPL